MAYPCFDYRFISHAAQDPRKMSDSERHAIERLKLGSPEKTIPRNDQSSPSDRNLIPTA